VGHIAEKVGTPKENRRNSLRAVQARSEGSQGRSGQVRDPGIGRVVKAHRKARMGRNPQTGERSDQGEDRVRLRPSKAFKDAILK